MFSSFQRFYSLGNYIMDYVLIVWLINTYKFSTVRGKLIIVYWYEEKVRQLIRT